MTVHHLFKFIFGLLAWFDICFSYWTFYSTPVISCDRFANNLNWIIQLWMIFLLHNFLCPCVWIFNNANGTLSSADANYLAQTPATPIYTTHHFQHTFQRTFTWPKFHKLGTCLQNRKVLVLLWFMVCENVENARIYRLSQLKSTFPHI